MKTLIIRAVVILGIFALIGFIWGKLKPVSVEVVYLDLKPTYRNSILRNLEKDSLSSSVDLPILDSENNSKKRETEENILPSKSQAKAESLHNEQKIVPEVEKNKQDSKQVDLNLDSIERSSVLFDTQAISKKSLVPPTVENSELTGSQRKEEGLIDQVKRFFSTLFSSKKDKEREDIEKQVQEEHPRVISTPNSRKDQNLSSNNRTIPDTKKAQNSTSDQSPKEPIVSSNFLLDDILVNEEKH